MQTALTPWQYEKLKKQEERTLNTFQAVAEEWHHKNKGRWAANHAKKVWGTIETDVLPWIGSSTISETTAKECLAIVRKVEERGALDVASRVKQRMSAIF